MKFPKAKKQKIELASGIPVFCKYDELVQADELKPHPDNKHRSHPVKQLDAYETVIAGNGRQKGNGWRKAIVVSLRDGHITKGHGAWMMARRRGWVVPVEFQGYRSLGEERRDIIADNKLPGLAITDNAKLAHLLSEMEADDVQLTGFSQAELDKILKIEPQKSIVIGALFEVIIECENEAAQKKIFEKLSGDGLKCRVLTL